VVGEMSLGVELEIRVVKVDEDGEKRGRGGAEFIDGGE
jgi:hypothetical protein